MCTLYSNLPLRIFILKGQVWCHSVRSVGLQWFGDSGVRPCTSSIQQNYIYGDIRLESVVGEAED